ncbi:MAG: hypothetical protein HQ477_11140 [Chloroflexi bacterium]|nr:hypothetical protein [Chloroflexota bacterium]
MPAKGTTTGNKQNWLRAIAIGLNVVGYEATNKTLEFWLRSIDGRKTWDKALGGFAKELPKDGTLSNYYTEARGKKTDGDRPWSIGQTVSGSFGDVISPEVLPFVLQIWLRSRVGGRDLTVRQARWCARLVRFYTIGTDADPQAGDQWIQTIYSMASLYAAREKLAESNQDSSGPVTGDLDAIIAFGMATLDGDAAASGSGPGLDVAVKLGLVSKLNAISSESARIDDEQTHSIRDWIVEAIRSEMAERDETSDAEAVRPKVSEQGNSSNPARIPYWASVYISLGIQALTSSTDWSSISKSEQQARSIKMGKAINHQDWDIFDTLTFQIETPDEVADKGD